MGGTNHQAMTYVLHLYRPFCCKRCQLIDLGEWADEEKCIKGESVSPENLPQNKTIYFEED